jgi:hypothetical protein
MVAGGVLLGADDTTGHRQQVRADRAERHLASARALVDRGRLRDARQQLRLADSDGADRDRRDRVDELIDQALGDRRARERRSRVRALVRTGRRHARDGKSGEVQTALEELQQLRARGSVRILGVYARWRLMSSVRRRIAAGKYGKAEQLVDGAADVAQDAGISRRRARALSDRAADLAYAEFMRDLDPGVSGGGGGADSNPYDDENPYDDGRDSFDIPFVPGD